MPSWILTDKGLVPKQEYLDRENEFGWAENLRAFGKNDLLGHHVISDEQFLLECQGAFDVFEAKEDKVERLKNAAKVGIEPLMSKYNALR